MAVPRLGVNVDHVATLRQVRGGAEPDPVAAALAAEEAGADGITVHLREDRRHIQDRDVERLRAAVRTKLNLEMAIDDAIVARALELRPDDACLVPERRQELTTEGGLDVVRERGRVAAALRRLAASGIRVSLFVAPDLAQIRAAREVGAAGVELHTGDYANAVDAAGRAAELARLERAGEEARRLGLALHAGHGLTRENVAAVAAIEGMEELNIGHSLVARAVFVGLAQAVREMKAAMASRPGRA